MKKIAVVTGSRAEYGLLKPLIKLIASKDDLELQLIVTGMHLMPKFGNTYLQIEEDGFHITAKISDDLDGDSSREISRAMGNTMIGFADALEELEPDIMVVLGDRSEIFSAVAAALIALIPVAHIHGGETTEGAYDDYLRHAITKMSMYHFASTEIYRKRIIQMGENPNKVFNVGAIGIDSIRTLNLMNRENFEKSIGLELLKNSVLITFHPVTLENASAQNQFGDLLKALDEQKNTSLIFTKPNSDKDGDIIIKMIDDYVFQNSSKAIAFTSLGQLRYLSALQYVSFVIGNSSSGILEVPYFKIPTINIGDRQKGRIMPKSVINCKPSYPEILKAIDQAKDDDFLNEIQSQENLYGDGHAAEAILDKLESFDSKEMKKPFYDVKDLDFEKP